MEGSDQVSVKMRVLTDQLVTEVSEHSDDGKWDLVKVGIWTAEFEMSFYSAVFVTRRLVSRKLEQLSRKL